jgi:hypothetical protein
MSIKALARLRKQIALKRQVRLAAVKRHAMRRSASAGLNSNEDVRASHGFIPMGVCIEVLSWPEL